MSLPNVSEHTPSVEDVRDGYAIDRHDADGVSYIAGAVEFDTWLADRDKQVRAWALREAADAWYDVYAGTSEEDRVGRLVFDWLRERAENRP